MGVLREAHSTEVTPDPLVRNTGAPDDVAALVLALDAGLFLQHLIDPEAIRPALRARALTAVIDPAPPD